MNFLRRWLGCQATCTCWLRAIVSRVVVRGHGMVLDSLPTNARCHMYPSNARAVPLQATSITPRKSIAEKGHIARLSSRLNIDHSKRSERVFFSMEKQE